MDATIVPSALTGLVDAVSSKSMAHRLLILAALANQPCEFVCNTTSQDIVATANCLQVLSDAVHDLEQGESNLQRYKMDCKESGSTLRFLLPVACALGIPSRFERRGRLAQRPLAPLDDELRHHGVEVAERGNAVLTRGKLSPGRFVLPGNVSSQYVSGLLLAATCLREPTEIWVCTPVQSRPYITLTTHALETFGQTTTCDKVVHKGIEYERFFLDPTGLVSPESCVVEGDWSNAAFWLAAGTMEPEGITVSGLDLNSPQGDRAVRALLEAGCPVRNQTVLLRGINDDPDTLAALLNGLTGIGVLPYYVFQCRPAMGVMHQFQVPLLEGQRVVDGARAQLNGQAKQFRYVMSHVTGKIEIIGRPFGEETLFKYHQAKSDADANRFFTVRLAEDQCWLGDDI